MSFLPLGQKEDEDTDARSRQIDDAQSVLNSTNLIKSSLKDIRVQNVCGSTAGAGSGTFHKYRQCKRREQFRLDILNKQHKIHQINERMRKRKRENDEILEKKRHKKRKLRQKKKERRHRKAKELNNNNDKNEMNETDEILNNKHDEIDINDNDKDNKNEDDELEELLNIDAALSNKPDINEEDEDDKDIQKQKSMNDKNKNEGDGETKTDKSLNEQDAILAALEAEFGE